MGAKGEKPAPIPGMAMAPAGGPDMTPLERAGAAPGVAGAAREGGAPPGLTRPGMGMARPRAAMRRRMLWEEGPSEEDRGSDRPGVERRGRRGGSSTKAKVKVNEHSLALRGWPGGLLKNERRRILFV